MDKELKEKWVTALRSGEYKQGVSVLKADSDEGAEYCCLGVLAEVAGCNWLKHYISERGAYPLSDGDGTVLSLLPLKDNYGVSRREQLYLADMNDRGIPFSDIADYIEETL